MWVAIAAITGWALITLYRMHMLGQASDRRHRERLAMIEKGLVPPPESDPSLFARLFDGHPSGPAIDRGAHSLRTGLLVLATGIGLGLMQYLQAGDALRARQGLGLGAFLVFIGIAFLVNAMFEARAKQSDPQPPQEQR